MSYDAKPDAYFAGCRADFVAALPDNPQAAVLEIGCAAGRTGELALTRGKCGRYVGVELSAKVADTARPRLSEVLVGNVEHMDLPFAAASFDALILSEVLEHLVDPWATLERLAPLVRPGGLVLASSPNISHYSVIARLLRGRWDLADRGVMDRTHLRWFTPHLFAEMFERAGFAVEDLSPVTAFAPRTRALLRLSGGRGRHLFMRQISLRGRRRGGADDGAATA